jgi:tetratricopeptide (TPR) repeat protein
VRPAHLLLPLLLAGCAARRPVAPGLPTGPRKATVPLYRPGPDAPKIYVEADLGDGVPRVFMVDTGAVVSVLTADVADELGLRTVEQPGRLVGLGGAVRWVQATVPEVGIGPMALQDVRFAVGVQGVPDHAGLVPVAGILGNNVWGHFELALDYPGNTLTLHQPGTMAVAESARPLLFDGQHIRTAAVLRAGQGDDTVEQPLVLEVDTGARDVILSGPIGGRLGTVATEGLEPIFGVGAGDELPLSSFLQQTRRVPLTAIEVGGTTVEERTTARWLGYAGAGRGGLAPLGMTGLIGHAVLDAHLVQLDYPGQRIALLPSPSAPTERDLHAWHLQQLRRDRSPEAIRQRARLLAYLDDPDAALQLLARWRQQSPDDAEAAVLEARILRLDGRLDEARAAVGALSPGDLVDAGEIVAAVNGHWLAGDAEGAAALARAAIAERPEAPLAWVAQADALRAAGDAAGARAALRRANDLTANPDGHLIRRAWVASEDGDIYGAITHARRLLELHPAGGVAAWMYARQVVGTDAEPLFRRDAERALARLHPGDGPLDFLAASYHLLSEEDRADALMQAGRGRDCVQARDVASRSNCEAWYRALAGRELDAARTAIDAALVDHPNRTEFLDTKAVVLEAQGDLEAARDAAWHAAALAPDDVYLLWQAARLDAATRTGG